ncbi:polysaccharide export protein [Pseudomonadales bacterium]|nr:polysaccharide export protein [Pseudomonadales bacterium]MDB9879348.1 polysaccharide export protein [Pseudomonadales bacterium]
MDVLLAVRFFIFFMLPSSGLAAESLSGYRLGSGDLIQIQVFDEEGLSMQVRLSDAATVSYPFLGEVRVAGNTVSQLEAKIVSGLKGDYLVDPKVNVAVVEYRSFYINGEVKAPGGYAFQPGLTLRKAVALAGGFTERASKTKMNLLADDVVDGQQRQVGIDEPLKPGDIITVKQSFF